MSRSCSLLDVEDAFADYYLYIQEDKDQCERAMIIFAKTFGEQILFEFVKKKVEIKRAFRYN
jgi:hypothetical protein